MHLRPSLLRFTRRPTCIAWWTGATAKAAWQIDALVEAGIYLWRTLIHIANAGTRACTRRIRIRPRPALVTDTHVARCIFGRQTGAMSAAQLGRLIGQAGVLPETTMGAGVTWPAKTTMENVRDGLVGI